MKKTIFIILVAILFLNACASPPPATPPPTLTPLPPTQTPLPPTPDFGDILFSEVSEKYTLVRDNNERFHIQDEDENVIPEISIDIKGNVSFGEEDIPVTLFEEDKSLTLIRKDDETFVFNGEKWVELIKNLPADLQKGYIYNNPNEDKENLIGATITDAEGKPLYIFVPKVEKGEETQESSSENVGSDENGEWIRDYERSFDAEGNFDLSKYTDNQLTMEDFDEGYIKKFFDTVLEPEFREKTNWNIIKDWPLTSPAGFLTYLKDGNNTIKFPNKETAPFVKDTGFCGELIVGKNKYLYILYALRDPINQTIEYVNLALPLQIDGVPLIQSEIAEKIRILEEEMNFFPIGMGSRPFGATQADPLFETHRDKSDDPSFEPEMNEGRDLAKSVRSRIIKQEPQETNIIKELNHLILLTYAEEVTEDSKWYAQFSNTYK